MILLHDNLKFTVYVVSRTLIDVNSKKQIVFNHFQIHNYKEIV